jgi:perosamine synthetase
LLGDVDELVLPNARPNRVHSWHLYCVRLQLEGAGLDRNGVIQELKRLGVGTSVHWMPLHLHPYYRDKFGYKPEDSPCATGLFPELMSLPLYPEMRDDEVGYVCDSLKRILARRRVTVPGVDLAENP